MPFKNETWNYARRVNRSDCPFVPPLGHAIVLIHSSRKLQRDSGNRQAGISEWQPDSRNGPIRFDMNVDNAPANTAAVTRLRGKMDKRQTKRYSCLNDRRAHGPD